LGEQIGHNPTMPVVSALILTLALQGAITPEVKAARKLAETAAAFAGKKTSRKKMFMLRDKGWVAMRKDTDHLKDEMWREDISTVAFVWVKDGKTLLVSFTGGSPSGDWSSSKALTYRPNGTLAHSQCSFAAFMFSGRILNEETVYDAKGKKIFSRVLLTDLNDKTISSAEERKQMLSSRPEIQDYLKTSQLPFLK
jgi:hypothetical protein